MASPPSSSKSGTQKAEMVKADIDFPSPAQEDTKPPSIGSKLKKALDFSGTEAVKKDLPPIESLENKRGDPRFENDYKRLPGRAFLNGMNWRA